MKPSVHAYENAVVYKPAGSYSLRTQFQPIDYKLFTTAELLALFGVATLTELDVVTLTPSYAAVMVAAKQDDLDPDVNVGATSQMAWYGLKGVLHGDVVFCNSAYLKAHALNDVTDSYTRLFTPKTKFV